MDTMSRKNRQLIEQDIKYMEEISLNAWPSYMSELYDGWLIRFSYNYTYRTNSVEQIGASTIPIDEKIDYCESVYDHFQSPCSFKIQPLLDPSFDHRLAQRGYDVRHITEVMTADLLNVDLTEEEGRDYIFENRLNLPTLVHYKKGLTVQLNSVVTDEWIRGLFHLNGTSEPTLRRIVPTMYAAIPKKTIAASIEIDGRIVATGLGIRDRGYVGLYAVYVSPSCWKRGYAKAICSTILREARLGGARKAYLQVVKGNRPAKALYESLGFQDFYTYWFRSKLLNQSRLRRPAAPQDQSRLRRPAAPQDQSRLQRPAAPQGRISPESVTGSPTSSDSTCPPNFGFSSTESR